jgi:hypothetical protein
MIKRQHRMRLAAAEIGLQLHNRVATGTGQPLHRINQQAAQAVGQVGPAEEFNRVSVFVGALAEMNLPQISGELGLLIMARWRRPGAG